MQVLQSKIYPDREKLVRELEKLKKQGKKIGFTNGTFDILHAGHILYLEEAKKRCDILVVSLNTDESVKLYKDDGRPIVPQQERALAIAGLQSIDYVIFHPERRMRTTLEILKPDYYIKGGDYDVSKLTSRDVLKQWGGEVLVVSLIEGKSTTDIIKKILAIYGNISVSHDVEKSETPQKTVFLDRDGVINKEIEYLHEPEKFEFIPHALEGIKKMQDNGFKIVVITNQAGIGLGYFTKEDFFKVNKKMLAKFHENGIVVSKVYFCPHSLEDNCDCRKPKTGLFEQAKKDLNVDFKKSFVIGDKASDIEAGEKIGAKTILVTTGHEKTKQTNKIQPDFIANDLLDASRTIK